MERKPGNYWITYKKERVVARWYAHCWNFGNKICHPTHVSQESDVLLDPICPTRCVCTYNPDGTVKIDCGQTQE